MNTYLLVVFVHVAAAVVLVGSSVVLAPAIRRAIRRARSTQDVRAYVALGRPLEAVSPVSALLLLLSGIYLASVSRAWTLAWVQVATLFWVVNAVVAAAVQKPVIGRLAEAAAAAQDGPVDARLDALRRSPAWMVAGNLLLANDVAMLFIMTLKPGMAGSLLAMVAANALVVLANALAGQSGRAALRPAAGAGGA